MFFIGGICIIGVSLEEVFEFGVTFVEESWGSFDHFIFTPDF